MKQITHHEECRHILLINNGYKYIMGIDSGL